MRTTRFLLIILSAVLCFACSDSESFTKDVNARLAFSTDTVSFDTIFCGIGSTTKRLIVYNRADKALLLKQVELESGSNSKFRMNVDGQFGALVHDVEIGAKDSIFIFLETTVDESADTLTMSKEKVLFTLESGVKQEVALEACGWKAISLLHERIESDSALTSKLPYVIYDSLVVAPNACLTLKAGVRLYFHKYANLIVHGALKIEGEAGNEVVLRCDRLDNLLPTVPYDKVDSQWGGVMLTNSCTGCDINYADIHGGNFGIICDSIEGNLNIHNSTIHNMSGCTLRANRANVLVTNSQLTYSSADNCISISRVNADFYHCTIVQKGGAYKGSALWLDFQGLKEGETLQDFHSNFYNCIITGSSDDEIFANVAERDTTTQPIHFYSCLLNTDISMDKYFTNCIAESKDSATYKETNFVGRWGGDDFRLDSLSVAIGKGNPEYTKSYPIDRDGKPHKTDKPDIGCFSSAKKE